MAVIVSVILVVLNGASCQEMTVMGASEDGAVSRDSHRDKQPRSREYVHLNHSTGQQLPAGRTAENKKRGGGKNTLHVTC